MKRGMIVLLLLGVLLVSPLVLAQEQAQVYSGFDRFIDNVKLVFSGGDNKVRLALDIREKEVDSAIINSQNQGEDKAIQNLERAKKKLQVVQEKVSLGTSEEIKTSVDEIIDKINEEEDLPDEFEDYLLEEEKTQLTAKLTEKTFEYCTELAKEDFALMLQEEICDPETAIPGLEKELEELKDIQLKLFVKLMLEIRSCVDDPGTCNCEANLDVEQKAKCEKMVALANRCEYEEDETSCNELESIKPVRGDGFAESFVPYFLKNLFKEKEYMIGYYDKYDINDSCGVPEECWDENDKPECRQYDHLKETNDDWDEYGNFIGIENKCGIEGPVPTMQESIPECFDGDIFLEEKCGKITVVRNEDGLVNYLTEKDIDGVLGGFENESEGVIEDFIEVDKVGEIKEEMDQIQNQIVDITYATGTGSGGDGGVVVDGDGGNAPGTSGDSPGNTVVDGGDNDVVTGGDNIVDSGGDGGSSNDVAGVDEGSGEPGVVDEGV